MAAQDVSTQTYDPSEVGAIVGHRAFAHPVKLIPSTTFLKGQVLALATANVATLTYSKYTQGAADGTQNAQCILRRACVTDAAGNITVGGSAAAAEYGQTEPTTSAWFGGVFLMSQINTGATNGLDAAGVAAMGGKLQRNGAELSF